MVNMVNIKENEDLSKLNHSCAHLLAQAVKHLYPNAKFWVGPVIEDGFYYDIDLGDRENGYRRNSYYYNSRSYLAFSILWHRSIQ